MEIDTLQYNRRRIRADVSDFFEIYDMYSFALTRCVNCGCLHLWKNGTLVYPTSSGIKPAEDMPEDIKQIFCEAQSIISLSPRASCALLRVCLERLTDYACIERGIECGKRDALYDKIQKLNLPKMYEEIFDACRLAGNRGAHAGEIDMSGEDTKTIAMACSNLVNSLVQLLVSPSIQSKRILSMLGQK